MAHPGSPRGQSPGAGRATLPLWPPVPWGKHNLKKRGPPSCLGHSRSGSREEKKDLATRCVKAVCCHHACPSSWSAGSAFRGLIPARTTERRGTDPEAGTNPAPTRHQPGATWSQLGDAGRGFGWSRVGVGSVPGWFPVCAGLVPGRCRVAVPGRCRGEALGGRSQSRFRHIPAYLGCGLLGPRLGIFKACAGLRLMPPTSGCKVAAAPGCQVEQARGCTLGGYILFVKCRRWSEIGRAGGLGGTGGLGGNSAGCGGLATHFFTMVSRAPRAAPPPKTTDFRSKANSSSCGLPK